MIPKIIHYCWFGGNPLPELAQKCIASWKKYCPDYEIKEWNESNFDLNCCDYVREAYEAKKWAFVSDYARFWILYHEGGVYFDTDVEVLKPIDTIVEKGSFMGCEKKHSVNPGLGMAAIPGLGLYKEMLDFYETKHFRREDGTIDITTIVSYTTNVLRKRGWQPDGEIQRVEGVVIYPTEYFCPKDYETQEIIITPNTYTIHHYTASWHSKTEERIYAVRRALKKRWGERGDKIALLICIPLRIMNKIEQRK